MYKNQPNISLLKIIRTFRMLLEQGVKKHIKKLDSNLFGQKATVSTASEDQ